MRLVFNAAPPKPKEETRPSTPDPDPRLTEDTVDEVEPPPEEPEPAAVVGGLLADIAEEQRVTIESICRQAASLPAPAVDGLNLWPSLACSTPCQQDEDSLLFLPQAPARSTHISLS